MAEREPKVSIGLPVYNAERFLPTAFATLLGQSFRDTEIVVCDNASTDATAEVCRRFQREEPRIRYFRNEVNLGVTGNYNRTARLARGRYFKWASANDTCHPDYVAECVEVLDSRPDVVLCYGRTRFVMDDGSEVDFDGDFPVMEERPSERWRKVLDGLRKNNAINGVLRRDTLMRTMLLGPYAWSDLTTMIELSLYGKFYLLPEVRFFRSMEAGANSADMEVADARAHYEPQTAGRLQFRKWREFYELGWAALRAPIALPEKWAIASHLLRLVWWKEPELRGELAAGLRALQPSSRRDTIRRAE